MSSADAPAPANLGSGHPSEPVIARIMAQPGVQRTPSPKLTLFQRRGFLSPDLCRALITQIDAQRRPSTVSDYNGDAAFRTSETCDLDGAIPVVAELERLIIEFIGIDPAHGEPIQGQRYAVGQEFKAHTDYFEPNGVDFHTYTSVAGNRTWTAMIYLNEPDAGGRHPVQDDRQDRPARNGEIALLEQPASGRQPQSKHHPSGHEGTRRDQICDYQMVSRAALGLGIVAR